MTEFPKSPDEVIDPRWSSLLHADTAEGPASIAEQHRARALADEMGAIIDPWQRGERSAEDTLEALRHLADQRL